MKFRHILVGAVCALGLSGAAIAQDGDFKATAEQEEAVAAAADAASASLGPDYYLVDMDPQSDIENVLYLDLSNSGRVAIRLKPEWAPDHVQRIKTLVRQGFYDGVIFHRVIDGFMAQTGDPTGTGQGGSPLPDLKAEFNKVPHLRGTVSMARTAEPDTANSQFFIVFYPTMQIDRQYTNFGRVIAGMSHVDAIARGEPPANPTKILQASLGDQHKAPPAVTPMKGPITADMLNAPLDEGSAQTDDVATDAEAVTKTE